MLKTNGKEFKSVVKGNNFLTPQVMFYAIAGNYHIEVSQGDGFDGKGIYGVTVVDGEKMIHDTDKSQSFTSMKEVNQYIKELERI